MNSIYVLSERIWEGCFLKNEVKYWTYAVKSELFEATQLFEDKTEV